MKEKNKFLIIVVLIILYFVSIFINLNNSSNYILYSDSLYRIRKNNLTIANPLKIKNKKLNLVNKKFVVENGYYKEDTVSVTLEGVDGAEKIKEILKNLRENLLDKIGNYKVLEFRDYLEGTIKNMITGKETRTDLPKSNVLYYELENDAWCCVRPSGTEPKIKFYLGVKEETMEKAEEAIELLGKDILKYSK